MDERDDFIAISKKFWINQYGIVLTSEEVREAIRNISEFFCLLNQWQRDEAIGERGTCDDSE